MSRSQTVEIVAFPSQLNKHLLPRLTLLSEPYIDSPFLSNKHVETIFAAFFRSLPRITYRRECLHMADGGTIALDWPIDGKDRELWISELAASAPTLILLPGLTGGSGDTYVRHMLIAARKRGWRVVVFNSRGCADSPVTTPQFYSASYTEDLRQVVKLVRTRYSNSRVYGVGWSLGANILVRYLGQNGETCFLDGAVSLANPFDLIIADQNFHKGFNNIYDFSLASALRQIFKKHASLFEEIGGDYNIEKTRSAKTVRDFDDGLTRVSFGFKTVDEYYYQSSSSHSIKDVKIPLLCIQAESDPIAASAGIPRAEIGANPNCMLVITPTGGHLGWIAGKNVPFGAPWTDPVVMEYLESLHTYLEIGKGLQQPNDETGNDSFVGIQPPAGSKTSLKH